MAKKPKLLAIIHLPPPVHGASQIGLLFANSARINEVFDVNTVNLAIGNDISRANLFDVYKVFRSISVFLSCARHLIFNRPDLVYVTANSAGLSFWKDFLVILMLKMFGVKHCMHYLNKGFFKYDQSLIGRLILRIYFWKSTAIFLSKHLLFDLKNSHKYIKMRFCPPGAEARPGEGKEYSEDSKIRLLFLSNLIREKGVIELLEAISIIAKKHTNFECVVAGQPGDISAELLDSEIRRMGIEKYVNYVGPVFGEEKARLYKSVDAFVFPTYYHRECFPLVLLEAMSYELPIVASNEAAIPEVVRNGENGYLVTKKDSEDLAKKLDALISDRPKMMTMGRNSKLAFDSSYTITDFESRMLQILLELKG